MAQAAALRMERGQLEQDVAALSGQLEQLRRQQLYLAKQTKVFIAGVQLLALQCLYLQQKQQV